MFQKNHHLENFDRFDSLERKKKKENSNSNILTIHHCWSSSVLIARIVAKLNNKKNKKQTNSNEFGFDIFYRDKNSLNLHSNNNNNNNNERKKSNLFVRILNESTESNIK